MNVCSDIIIIGAGAAGMAAAAAAAENGAGVILLEKMPRPGRKIMITGKGRCNFTNMKGWEEFSRHVHPSAAPLRPAFMNLTPEKTVDFFGRLGLESVTERGDRVFPVSHVSADVVDALSDAARRSGAKMLCGKEVVSVSVPASAAEGKTEEAAGERADKGGATKGSGTVGMFEIRCADGSAFECRKLIIATGGLSYPGTGSDGFGLRWAGENGLKIVPTFPSLTAIVPENYKKAAPKTSGSSLKGHIPRETELSETGKLLQGQTLKNISLSISVNGDTVQEEFGDIEFTDAGLEGPVGFKVSRKCVKAIVNGSSVRAKIDLKPAVDETALAARLETLRREIAADRRSAGKSPEARFRVLLGKLLPREMIDGFVKCNPGLSARNLAVRLKNWELKIAGYAGYERSVVTAGGVSTDEIRPKTMESKRIAGLYLAGEMLDFDADTGGYNLQIAFSTGYLAGVSAAKSL